MAAEFEGEEGVIYECEVEGKEGAFKQFRVLIVNRSVAEVAEAEIRHVTLLGL